MTKTTFYLFLVGRLGAGAIIAAAALSFSQGRPMAQVIFIQLLAFAVLMTVFWVPPFTYNQYLRATERKDPKDDPRM